MATLQFGRIHPGDLDELIAMCAEHAKYERAGFANDRDGIRLRDRLSAALFDSRPVLHGWIARDGERAIGYATATIDFATWTAQPYLHLDCLFIREPDRSRRIGGRLFELVRDFARQRDLAIQWQTPDWNVDAQRFYGRLGATSLPKRRYSLIP